MKRVVLLRRWDRRPPRGGTALVIDVLRFSTTLCALLGAGRRRIWAAPGPRALPGAGGLDGCDVFSELEFDCLARRYDNSPALALAAGGGRRRAYVTTTTGSRALAASRAADRILVGCFANFHAALRRLRAARGTVWLLPAASPGTAPGREEDELCATAFRQALAGDAEAPRRALAALRMTRRIGEFLRMRPKTGAEDLALALALDRLPVVPEAFFDGAPEDPLAAIRRAR